MSFVGRWGFWLAKVALLVVVPLRMLIACDAPPPNPLATSGAGGAPPPPGSGSGSGGSVFIGAGGAGGAGGRPAPAPVISQAALTVGTATGAPATRAWPTASCPGGPCAAPRVCVNLDFLFVACVACGGGDQSCCPAGDACDAGLVCGPNPNYQQSPPMDLVKNVCQTPGAPPTADHGLNHQRQGLD